MTLATRLVKYISACFIGGALMEAAEDVVPVAWTACEAVQRLRAWASGRCLNAEAPGGIYLRDGETAVIKPGRKVRRDPSNN